MEDPKVVPDVRPIGAALHARGCPYLGVPDEEVFKRDRLHGGELPCHKDLGDREEEDRAECGGL
jgi:hypothetical protein